METDQAFADLWTEEVYVPINWWAYVEAAESIQLSRGELRFWRAS